MLQTVYRRFYSGKKFYHNPNANINSTTFQTTNNDTLFFSMSSTSHQIKNINK